MTFSSRYFLPLISGWLARLMWSDRHTQSCEARVNASFVVFLVVDIHC